MLLEDGTRFDGEACGAAGHATGEIVFTTSMSGYQEAVTDPSFAGQLITFTSPHVGNYGVSAAAMESDAIHARAVIMREAVNREDAPTAERGWLDWLTDCGVPGDHRRRHPRAGAPHPRRGRDARRDLPRRDRRGRGARRDRGRAADGRPRPGARGDAGRAGRAGAAPGAPGGGPRIVAIDTGIKTSIVTNLRQRGATVELHPCTASSETLLARDADAYFLANGPGDPAALDYVVDTLRDLVGTRPVFGICLGHQLLCRAVGLETYKLPFGHRGANHPVKDLTTGRIEITSQNHGFAVLGPGGEERIVGDEPVRWTTDFGAAQLTHLNLYDRTVEGLALLDVPGGTVQYHPEAGPGPHDSLYLFDRFLEQIADAA